MMIVIYRTIKDEYDYVKNILRALDHILVFFKLLKWGSFFFLLLNLRIFMLIWVEEK